MPINSACLVCKYAKATPGMELVCPHGGNPHRCERHTRITTLVLAARCEDCIRHTKCNRGALDSPLRCKFFDLKGDTVDIVRNSEVPRTRWRRLDYGR